MFIKHLCNILIKNNITPEYITFSTPSNFTYDDRYKFLKCAELSDCNVHIIDKNIALSLEYGF